MFAVYGTPVLLASNVEPRDNQTIGDQQTQEFFEKHIRPLFVQHCYDCHSVEAGKEGGLHLDSKEAWLEGGHSGPALIPGDPAVSLLVRAVNYEDPDLRMPPDGKLAGREIQLLESWIRKGAEAPNSNPASNSTHVDPADPVLGREHWAFQPLTTSAALWKQRSPFSNSPIDTLINAQLQSKGLLPAPLASPAVLARRVHVLITGLPPTSDPSDKLDTLDDSTSYERLVDRLLASPRYGERWGRHWLDLARYADSNGLDENFLFREAWRYRNWVLAAWNQDLSWDQFITQQIAGDLLPYDDFEQRDRQRIAAGFLVIGPKVLLGNDDRERVMDVADEQLDTIGKALLGQTLGCARCHDHKFDPIPTQDYYALAGILTSTEVMERRYMLGQQRTMERLVGLGANGEQSDEAYEAYWREHKEFKEALKQAREALQLLKDDDQDALAQAIEKYPESVAEIAKDQALNREERIAGQLELVKKLEVQAEPVPIPPRAMIPTDAASPKDEHIRLAGQFDRLGKEIPRGFLQVLSTQSQCIPEQQSGRMQLAEWLFDTERGAGQLVARVLANRIWMHMMGRGIVRTADNFGRTGESPTHPELLDYLAQRLIDSGWSVKSLIREIALSEAFRRSSQQVEQSHSRDPDNIFLWRAHRRRLSPEVLRDSMLAAADTLDLAKFESTVSYLGDQATAVGANKNRRRTDFPCRSVYLPVIRNDLPEIFDAFSFADPHATTGVRPQTLAASQGLYLMNDAFVVEASSKTAERLLRETDGSSDEHRVERLFEWLLISHPSQQEQQLLVDFVRSGRSTQDQESAADEKLLWSQICQSLFASSRFQILE
ncbi:MAG: PSD1 and planctomycete cytochrome C domain-containing protein [bacterium]|nr:PSD1 and planctomycete cytochrome C domain-containing protein [bacterium]